MSIGETPLDDNYKPIAAWDPTNHRPAVPDIANGGLDNGIPHGPLAVDVTVSIDPASNQRVNTQAGDIAAGSAVAGAFVDGAIATLGTEADAAVTNSASSGTLMAFIKGVVSLLASVLKVARSAVTLFSTAQTLQGSGNSGDLTVGPYTEIGIDITTTAQAGTNPTIQFFWERKGADGNYYPIWTSATFTAASNVISTSIGAGMSYPASLGVTGRLRWAVGGTGTPQWTFTPNVYGK